ncbi:MAG: DNA topoisomerase IV subunit A [Deltaproteobacteria bacterium]|nr:DNA topoisomerase IV subunit A [Deltaproteobacteria bacterium]
MKDDKQLTLAFGPGAAPEGPGAADPTTLAVPPAPPRTITSLEDFRRAVTGERGRDYIPAGPYMDKSYLDYSVSVLMQRAIPDVRDGLKPVHRRILYAMSQLGLTAKSAHKKSARVVGDVIGKYHPHGDASVYEAMVLMAQPFTLRHTLIDGQGNWGSLDGDSAAAMRYTEARMTEFSRLLLDEINLGTVDWRPNYDGNDEEPVSLPSRVPTVLLNDQMGIAVGMASDVPAHNLEEVCRAAIAVLRNPEATLDDLLRHIQGPDFAGGGQLINSRAEIAEIYRTGRGMLTVRARYEVKKDANGWYLVFTELPPKVSPETVQLELEAISNPQTRAGGKKGEAGITAEQRAAKQVMLGKISEINNGAGNDTGPVHLEVFPRSRRQSPEELASYLFGVTSLESRVKVNVNLINLKGLPTQMSLLDILRDWTRYRFDTVTRRCRHRLEKVDARLHILEGFVKILLDIDEVIRLIRASENDQVAKQGLMERWSLSEIQADKILDMKLRQLTKLDELSLRGELSELEGERAGLQTVLDDRAAMTDLIVSELEQDSRKFGTPRRTLIEEATAAETVEAVIDEPVTIILSRKGWLRSRSGRGLDLTGLTFKDGDGLHTIVETRTTRALVLLDVNGRAYTVPAHAIPGGKGDGAPATSLVELQQKAPLVAMFADEQEGKGKVLLASSSGYGFVTEIGHLVGRNRAGKSVVNTDGGVLLPPVLLGPEADLVAAVSSAGYLLVFPLGELPELPKGKGNKIMALRPGERLARLMVFSKSITLPNKRAGSELLMNRKELEEYTRNRGARGRLVPKNVAIAKL